MSIITGYIVCDLVGIFITAALLFILYCKWAFRYWKNKNVPYIEPTIPWGNLQPPTRKTVSLGEEISEIYREGKSKGWKHLGMYSLTNPNYMPIDLDIVKNILTKDFNHFVDRGIYYNERDQPISAHLFAIGGKKWRNLRMKFTPTFTSGKMRQMFQTLTDCGTKLEQFLINELSYHEPIDIKNVLGNFSTDIIGSCAFGLECNSFKDPNNPFRVNGNKVFSRPKTFEGFKFAIKFAFSLSFPKLARFLGVTLLDNGVSDFFTKVVSDTVNYREKNNVKRHDFLQLLIEIRNNSEGAEQSGDGKTLTMDEMVAQSFVFFVAGFETSSTTMSFALYELSKHPEIQSKVRKEIVEVLRKHDGAITYDSLKEMKYLGQVIDETLRKFPAVPLITRKCIEDYVVPSGTGGPDVTIEKGTMVFFSIRGIHYDPEYYESPEVFDPERFSSENKSNRNQYAFLPFGEGPRMCIGMRFGIMQSKVGLVSILKNFKVSLNKKTADPLKIEVNSLVPQVVDGVWLDLEKI